MCANIMHALIYKDNELKKKKKKRKVELNSVHVSMELDFTKQTY